MEALISEGHLESLVGMNTEIALIGEAKKSLGI
jgi:hypothetical protein